MLAVDGSDDGPRIGVVAAYWAIQGGVVGAEMEEAASCRCDCITMKEPCGLHGSRFRPDTILLRVKKECHSGSSHEGVVGCVSWDDPVLVVELEVPKAELCGTAVRGGLGILAGSEAEEEGNLDEVCGAGGTLGAVGISSDTDD